MKECSTKVTVKCTLIGISLIFALSGVMYIYMMLQGTIDINGFCIGAVVICFYLSVGSVKMFFKAGRKILYNEEKFIIILSEDESIEYRWQDIASRSIAITTHSIAKSSTKNKSLFGGKLILTKGEKIINLNPNMKGYKDFLATAKRITQQNAKSQVSNINDVFNDIFSGH